MLQAVSQNGQLVTPALLSRKVIATIRKRHFFCPLCKEIVVLRAGESVTAHFAHRKSSNCSTGGGEGEYHMRGKLQLFQWLQRQNLAVELEVYISEINQRPDILLQLNNRKIAIEFQSAKINPGIIKQRNIGYKRLGVIPIWILGANRFKRLGKNKIKIDTFTLQTLQQFSPRLPTQLLYYCPDKNIFSLVSDLHMTKSQQALAHITFQKAAHIRFPHLFQTQKIPRNQLYSSWFDEKLLFRTKRSHLYGTELQFQKWLYQQGCHIEQLPAIIHLPNRSQHMMKQPTWYWQSYFIIGFLHPKPIGHVFLLQDVQNFLYRYLCTPDKYPLISQPSLEPVQIYLKQLENLGVIKFNKNGSIVKRKPVHFFNQIEEGLRGDEAVMKRLGEECRNIKCQ